VLEQLAVVMQPSADSGLTEDFIIQLPSLSAQTSPGTIYVSFTRDEPAAFPMTSFSCVLKFISKEVDPTTGEPEEEGYEDEYQLEDVELSAGGDYLIPTYVNFSAEWDRLRGGATATETFALSAMESIKGPLINSFL
jgi:coatomer subunit gamma